MLRPPAMFYLPNTTTLLARSAINLLKGADQALLDEAITTLQNRSLSAAAVMPHLEQSVNVGEALERLAKEWSPETVRAFAAALNMDAAKTDVMDLIVAIAILNEADLEAELRGENTPEATAGDLLENRRITWQYPPPGTLLNPPYLVLVAVEQLDTSRADSEVQAILGELVDYKGYKMPRRAAIPPFVKPTGPFTAFRPDLLRVAKFTEMLQPAEAILTAPAVQPSAPSLAVAQPLAAATTEMTKATAAAFVNASRIRGGF